MNQQAKMSSTIAYGLALFGLACSMSVGAADGSIPAAATAVTTAGGTVSDDVIARAYEEQLAKIQVDYQVKIDAVKAMIYADYDAQLKAAMQAANVDLAISLRAKRDALKESGMPPDSDDAVYAKYKPQLKALAAWLSLAKGIAHKNALAGYDSAIATVMKQGDLDKAVELKRLKVTMQARVPAAGGVVGEIHVPQLPSTKTAVARRIKFVINERHYFEKQGGGKWVEIQNGKPAYRFEEVARKPDYVEILDRRRNVIVRLLEEGVMVSSTAGTRFPSFKGKWDK